MPPASAYSTQGLLTSRAVLCSNGPKRYFASLFPPIGGTCALCVLFFIIDREPARRNSAAYCTIFVESGGHFCRHAVKFLDFPVFLCFNCPAR